VSRSQRQVLVGAKVGLHARPASLLVQAVVASGHAVTITSERGDVADGASILSVLTLGAMFGESVDITVNGDDADRVADELAVLIASDLDANEV
jgi:phosphocarrier protein